MNQIIKLARCCSRNNLSLWHYSPQRCYSSCNKSHPTGNCSLVCSNGLAVLSATCTSLVVWYLSIENLHRQNLQLADIHSDLCPETDCERNSHHQKVCLSSWYGAGSREGLNLADDFCSFLLSDS